MLAAEAEEPDSFAAKYLTLRTIETGLSPEKEGIRTQMQPYLRNPSITADELAEKLRTIMAAEKNRETKLAAAAACAVGGKAKGKTQVNNVSVAQNDKLLSAI